MRDIQGDVDVARRAANAHAYSRATWMDEYYAALAYRREQRELDERLSQLGVHGKRPRYVAHDAADWLCPSPYPDR